ncbi:hypothetical protein Clacol_005198 [Clathrus columnatus]|uniref:Uncharacterized protein n=1 Tax=Clathrus columnatus TaxID=1419009 RepID=A0AAV5ACP9_9AGAM|nr:hypothetical protein Clacol_005198 [Clathrus columnatus]
MSLRILALYNRSRYMATFLALINIAQIVVTITFLRGDFAVAIPALAVCRLTRNLQRLSSDHNSRQYQEETVSGEFTTAPTRIRTISINASPWLTGEQWGQFQDISSEVFVQKARMMS